MIMVADEIIRSCRPFRDSAYSTEVSDGGNENATGATRVTESGRGMADRLSEEKRWPGMVAQ